VARHDDEVEFDEYLEERAEPVRGSQRLLIIILGVGCLALAVSNVVLAMRVTQIRRTVAAERAAVAPAPVAERANTTERPAEPLAPAASIGASAPTPAASEPAPTTAKTEVVAPKLDLPSRSRVRDQAPVAAMTRATDRPAAVPSSPERSTAAWMVQEYGRPDAERRAAAVAEFYGAHSPDGAYWRRVLAEINATRR
jgi:type IV secretory pathway VirB10-like protein